MKKLPSFIVSYLLVGLMVIGGYSLPAATYSDLLPPMSASGRLTSVALARDVAGVRVEVGGTHSTAGPYYWKLLDAENNDAVLARLPQLGEERNYFSGVISRKLLIVRGSKNSRACSGDLPPSRLRVYRLIWGSCS